MSDLISRQAAIDVLEERIRANGYSNVGLVSELNRSIGYLMRLPSADRPTGKWINHFDDLFPEDSTIECSICHEHQSVGIDENYCPNCGADMKGEDDEN